MRFFCPKGCVKRTIRKVLADNMFRQLNAQEENRLGGKGWTSWI